MVQSALSLPVGDVGPFWDARVTAHETNRLIRFITQRVVDRKPASYITGEAWLQGHAFKVDERVIIPRSFIAELLADQLTPWVNAPEMPFEILDMCTGSGCLAILAAYVFENAQVDAVDLSTEALSIARENIQLHDMKQRVHAIESDLFSNLNGKQYDFILTNPPYVNEASMKKLPPEYLHEPRMALAGGDSGMDLIQDILEQAPKHLKDGGFLVVELGNEKLHFEAAFPHLNPIWLETSAVEESGDMEQLGHLYEELENLDGYTAEARVATILHGLGFKTEDLQRKVGEFSGGWKMRLNLAKVLGSRADLILLDEPTNHLDIEAVVWLEQWIKQVNSTVILVSHDRDFLDEVCTHTVHLNNEKLTKYTGGYSAFERAFAERADQVSQANKKAAGEMEKLQKFVDRFKAKASKAKQAQSRVKRLEKIKLIETLQVEPHVAIPFMEPHKSPDPLV
eukprot:gene10576-biopygen9211